MWKSSGWASLKRQSSVSPILKHQHRLKHCQKKIKKNKKNQHHMSLGEAKSLVWAHGAPCAVSAGMVPVLLS